MAKSRLSVRALLIGGNVALVLAAVLGVVAAGTSLLRRLADDEALARVNLAGISAAHMLEHSHEQIGASAHHLSGQASIARLLAPADQGALQRFLETYRATSGLSGCAVVLQNRLYASAGSAIPWNDVLRAAPPAAEGLVAVKNDAPLLLAASAAAAGVPGVSVVTVLALDDSYQATMARQIGLPVVLLNRESALAREGLPNSAWDVRSRALDSEADFAAKVRETGAFVAVQPLRAPNGAMVGILEATLPPGAMARSTGRFVRSLFFLSMIVAGLAVAFGVLLGRRLIAPLEELMAAAQRIGRGDLSTPVPGRDATEIGTLAGSMDDMRARLMELTGELRRRQAQAEAVLGGIVEGVFAVDRERIIRYANPQVAGILGLTPDRILGRFCGDVLKPRTEGGVRPCDERCPILHARFRGSTRAVEHLDVGGDTRAVVINSAAPETAEGQAAMQFQVIRDETDTEATGRLRDAVLANISHEFRTPLSAQLASIELLRDRLPEIEPKEVRDLVLAIERGTLRLTQLIDNLLESVRIDSGTDSIRRRQVALDEVVEAAVEMTSPLAALRQQSIHVNLPYPLPLVSGDGPRLVQVFVNLLANASKFAPAGTAVHIGGEIRDGEVVLWVEDEGPGLPDLEEAPRFERFRRSPGEEPEESGMGLGLFIVKSIVERHGGRVEVRGGAEGDSGKGTRMCVALPVAVAAA